MINHESASAAKIYSVSEITSLIRQQLERAFPGVAVEGEVSNFHLHQSGHVYMTLKDEKSQIRVVMFRPAARKIPFRLENGLQVICIGRINVYEPRGEYQLLVDRIEPKGKGALQLAFDQLKAKLRKEGLFDPEIKKPLPLLPRKIGIVTSPRGAAIIDILRTLERRFARLHVIVFPAKVQGEGAAEEIIRGVETLSRIADMDAVIVGRGGGSMEDLWAFNDERLARAIHRCPVPVISAVGHEVDFTISDFVADVRAATPTAAAELVVEKEGAFREKIEALVKRLEHHTRFAVQNQRQLVFGLIHHQAFQNLKVRILNQMQKVDDLETRARKIILQDRKDISETRARAALMAEKMIHAERTMRQRRQAEWERLSAGLHAMSPLNVLKKGYAICWTKDGKRAIHEVEGLKAEDEIVVSFARGEFTGMIRDINLRTSVEDRIRGLREESPGKGAFAED